MKTLLLVATMMASLPLMAQEEMTPPIFYWDNQEQLVQVDESKCHITKVATNRFRVSKYFGKGTSSTENLRNRYGRRTSYLPNSSIVKTIPSTHKMQDYEHIEVVGVNKIVEQSPIRWSSKRLDRGFLYYKSLHPIDDYAFKLNTGAPEAKVGKARDNLNGTFIRVAVEDSYFQLNCPQFEEGRDYILFRVYDEKFQQTPIAYTAIYWDETKILRSFEAFPKNEAHSFVNHILFEDRLETELEGRIGFGAPLANTDTEVENDDQIEADDNAIDEEATNDMATTTSDPDAEETDTKSFDYRVCIDDNTLNIRNEDLNRVLFKAKKGEKVKIFQGWGNNTQMRSINGVSYTFIKVELAERESSQKVGWAAKRYVQTKENCKNLRSSGNDDTPSQPIGNITSLDDPDCCEFPTVKKVTHRFNSGMRRFGAGRSGGKRLHAACDLYRYKDEPALSVAPGKVIRNKYYFYQGTYALEIKHAGGFVVRYGEITGKSPSGVYAGKSVKTGQRIGYIGKVNSNCCRPMLHFELYRGNKSGALSTSGNRYRRRSDLMDPTKYLLRWEDRNF